MTDHPATLTDGEQHVAVCLPASASLDVLGSERRDCRDCGTDVQVPERIADRLRDGDLDGVVCLACAVDAEQEVPNP